MVALCNAAVTYLLERMFMGQASKARPLMVSLQLSPTGTYWYLTISLLVLLPLVLWGINHLKTSKPWVMTWRTVWACRWLYLLVPLGATAAIATVAIGPIALPRSSRTYRPSKHGRSPHDLGASQAQLFKAGRCGV